MRKYYTRPCNFYYGNYAKKLVKKNKALTLAGNPNISFDGFPLRVDYNIDGSISLGQETTANPEAWIVQVKKIYKEKKANKDYNKVNKLL